MAVFDPSMTANKVADLLPQDALNASGHSPDSPDFVQTKGYVDATRKGRKTAPMPAKLDIDHAHLAKRVRIFNVGPWPQVVPLGSTGTVYIPACPSDKPYVEMISNLHELEIEYYPINQKKEWKELREEGHKIAIEILGEGRNQDRRYSLRKKGVFIAAGEIPTEAEVAQAKKELLPTCQRLVDLMDQLWDRDRKLAYDVYNPSVHGESARILNITGKPWQSTGKVSDSIACPYCDASIKPSAPKCHNCHEVVNAQAYSELKAKMAEQQMEVETAPKKK